MLVRPPMLVRALAVVLLLAACTAGRQLYEEIPADDDDPSPLLPPWTELSRYFRWRSDNVSYALQSAWTSQASALLSAREAAIGNISSLQEWQARQQHVKELLRDRVFWPVNESTPRTPLNPRVTRTFHDPRGFSVHLLTFESRPKFYVTAALFVPDGATNGARDVD
jgi:hypothetical protein